MADLKTNLLGFTMNSPIIGASGTVGYGVEYEELADFSKIGGISGKGLTLHGQYGNKGERLWETPSGLINSIGLQNPGVQHFIDVELGEMLELKQKYGTVAIANLGGHSEEEYVEGAALLSESGVDIVELNISCPNVKVGGMAYGVKAEAAGEVVRMVRDACRKPLMVKLSPQAENIPEMCKAVEAAGADAISLTNTFQACAIDLEKRRPVFDNIFAGLSGPAMRPIALRMVWQAVGAVNIPVVGLGGIATGKDALEFIMAGATAVQVGAANFANPRAMETIAEEMAAWMDAHGVKAEAAGEVVRMVRDACKKPLMVKLSPQAENIPAMCKAVEAAGADAISLTNTFQACAIDLEKRRPVFDNIFAGLSGPAVRPIALRMVWQAVGAVNIPVVGLGGIATGRDALEFIMAGAAAVQVGAANFANPRAMETIAEEMAAWMDAHGVRTLDEIRGCAR